MPIKRRWPDFPTMRDRPLSLSFARALVAFQHCANAHGGRSDEAQKKPTKPAKGAANQAGCPLGFEPASVSREPVRGIRGSDVSSK